MKREIRFDRLRELANHLLTGKLGHKKFVFSSFNGGFLFADEPRNTCGTYGCALGECPILWPNDWEFDLKSSPILRADRNYSDFEVIKKSAKEWFGITSSMYFHLFHPGCTRTHKYGGEILDEDATKEQVANNIIIFCDRLEAEQKEEQ